MRLLLIATLLVCVVVAHDRSWIDQVIELHYQRAIQEQEKMMQSGELDKRFLNPTEIPTPEKIPHNSKCNHDEHMGPYLKNIKKRMATIDPSEFETKNQTVEYEASKRQTLGSIRFIIENKMGIDTDYECTSVGQTATIGYPSSPAPSCSTSVTSNCIYTCTSQDIASTNLRSFLQNSVMGAVANIYAGIVQVQRESGNLVLNSASRTYFGGECQGIDIPSSYTSGSGVGQAGDMLVWITARPCGSSGTVAYATGCNYKAASGGNFGRPLAGMVNMCVKYFKQFEGNYTLFDFVGAVKVALHEFTHALGFSSSVYTSFTNGATDYACTNTAETVSGTSPAGNDYSQTVNYITTSRVVETARAHYGCPSIDKVELEEAGGSGTAGSHWDKRIVMTELMAGYINPLMPLSRLTLSLLADSGWYTVDYNKAEWWVWGKNAGCGFLNERCEVGWNNTDYLCLVNNQAAISRDYQAKGFCNYRTNLNLIAYWQHFSNPNYGGSDLSSNACPYVMAAKENGAVFCSNTDAVAVQPYEYFGNDSKVFVFTSGPSGAPSMACWQFRCNIGNIQVNLGGTWVTCTNGNTTTTLTNVGELSGGTISCPPANIFCSSQADPPGTYVYTGSCSTATTDITDLFPSGATDCFVATASYGTQMNENIYILREVRDEILMTNYIGRAFVDYYYSYGPAVAKFVAASDLARFVVRCFLYPIIQISQFFLTD